MCTVARWAFFMQWQSPHGSAPVRGQLHVARTPADRASTTATCRRKQPNPLDKHEALAKAIVTKQNWKYDFSFVYLHISVCCFMI
jgi:hypothetical protein